MKRKTFLSALMLGLVMALPLAAQVRGVIVDVNGEPIIGASILEKGTTNGTITDFDGNFSLDVAEGVILEISYVGYAGQSLPAAADMHVVLKEDTELLEEVVVIGYGVQKKSDLTGSIAQVSDKDLQKTPAPSLGSALEGRAAGLQVTGSGAPGSNVSLNIRGIGSINNSQPLIVIDGVPTDVPLNMINMDDVASVDVLKDASATAIYGSRGAYGVVIITTKKGENEKGHISLKASFGFDQIQRTLPLLKAYQFASLHNEMMTAAGQPQYVGYENPEALGDGTDWMSELWQFAPTQNYSLSYSGGTQKSNFYVSGAFYDQKGIIKTTGYRRITLQFNHDTQLFDWLRFGHKLSLNHDVKSSGEHSIQNTMRALPTQAIYNEDGSWAGPVGLAMYVGDIANPIGKMNSNKSTTKGYNLLGNIYAEIKPVDWVIFKTTFGMQVMYWDTEGWTPAYNWQPIAQPESQVSHNFDKSITWLWDNTLTFVKTFKEKHSFTAMVGSSMQANNYEYMSGSVQGFISESARQLSNGLLEPTLGGNKSDWSLLSFMGRVTYGYDNRYMITATVRADGSSRFAKKNRWGVFPSVAAAWRISEEHWFKKTFWLTDFKLRAGYGQTGNQASVGNYAYASQLQTVQYVFGDKQVAGLAPWVLPNPNVRWETVEQYNVGLDLALFDQRLHATVDWYMKNTNNMLVNMSVPISSGYSDEAVPSINAGRMRNTGVEVSLNSLNFKGDFTWTTTVNFAYNKNSILSLNNDVPMYFDCNIHKVGFPVASYYGYVTDGIFQTREEVEAHAVQTIGSDQYTSTQPGDIRFKDLNNDGVINEEDRTILGSPIPSWTFSMNNRFEFYGVDVELYLQGAAGNKIYNGNRATLEAMSVAQNQMTTVLDRWRPDYPSTTMPRAVFSDPNKNNRVSDRFLEPGDYLRIKSITVGYTLPKKYTQKALMDEVRFAVSGQNLYTFTKYKGLDPEVGGSGIDSNVYPLTRNFTFQLNITF